MDKKVIRAKVQLMLNYPFFGALAARLELKEWDKDTFATNGKHILVPAKHYYDGTDKTVVKEPGPYFGKPMYPGYDDKQLEAVIAHEVGHCALLHIFRLGNRNPQGFNIAGDFVINWMLKQENFTLPPSWLYDEKFANMHTEKVYELLKKESQKGGKGKKPKDGGEPGEGGCGGYGGNPFDEYQTPGNMKDVQYKDKKDSKDGQGQEGDGPTEADWKDAIANAANQAKQKGKLPAGFEEFINDFLDPKIPWQQVLLRYLQSSRGCSDYRGFPYRRSFIHRGLYVSSLAGDSVELVCAIDTSGSIGQDEFKSFLGEICGICRAFGEYKIHLLQCDAKVQEYTEIESETDIPNKMKGRGGTSFVPVFDKVDELELNDLPLVYFTDLCGDFPTEERPSVYWVVKEEWAKHAKPPFGEVIELTT